MEVTLTFKLDEEVTPNIFACRVAEACANYGALRPGEGVEMPDGTGTLIVSGNAGQRTETVGLFPPDNRKD